jgi:hypothetical protein
MADRNKFEEMLERLINEDKAGAEELFHEIVVAKSRDIYESLLETDLDEIDEASKDEDEEEMDEASKEDDEDKVDEASKDDEEDDLEENFNLDEFEVEGEDEMGGDPTDDMMGDVEVDGGDMDDMGDDMGGEEELEDRVVDLEDALDDLKAEFEKMMAGEDGEEGSDDEVDMDDMGDDEEGEEGEEKEAFNFGEAEDDKEEDKVEEKATAKSSTEQMREYVEKVTAKMGDNGANTKSTVAGKNDMGVTSANIAKGGESKGEGTNGGLAAPTTKEENAGNVNVPGGKASKSMKAEPKGHGAEKKGAGEQAADKKSIIGSK